MSFSITPTADMEGYTRLSVWLGDRCGTNGDTELFKKSRNINGFRACRIANNLY